MELDQRKILMIGGAGVVAIFVLSKLSGKGGDAASTPQISNIGPSGSDVNERYKIQAESSLAQQQGRQAGLDSLLGYSVAQKTLDTQYALGAADLTNTLAIKTKELDTAFQINKDTIASQNLQAQLASQTTLGVAGIQAGVEMAAIGSQVQIASIAAGVQSERTKADLTLGLRGYDSADFKTSSDEKLGLANIDLQRFGIKKGFQLGLEQLDVERQANFYGFRLGRKQINEETARAQIGANRDITLGKQQTDAQIQIAKISRPKWWESLLGGLGGIGQVLTGGGGLFPGGFR